MPKVARLLSESYALHESIKESPLQYVTVELLKEVTVPQQGGFEITYEAGSKIRFEPKRKMAYLDGKHVVLGADDYIMLVRPLSN